MLLASAVTVPLLVQLASASVLKSGSSERVDGGHLRVVQDNIRKRELILRRYEVYYSEALTEVGATNPPSCTLGVYCQNEAIEKWVKYRGANLAPDRCSGDPLELFEAIRDSVSPSVFLCDGVRTALYGPRTGGLGAWDGILTSKVDNSIRSGGMNCCMLFGERWFSEFLDDCRLIGVTGTGNKLEYTVVAGEGAQQSVIRFVADNTGFIYSLEWSKQGRVRMLATVLEAISLGSAVYPLAGNIKYNYGPGASLDTRYAYVERSEGVPVETSLLSLPSELVNRNAVVIMSDEASGSRFQLDRNGIASLDLISGTTGEDTGAPDSRVPEASDSANANGGGVLRFVMAALAVVMVLSGSAVIWTRRRAAQRS